MATLLATYNQSSQAPFLSTPPSRVATRIYQHGAYTWRCFYPRHPRGWRQRSILLLYLQATVSIHATLAGGDAKWIESAQRWQMFLSTPPSRVATAVKAEIGIAGLVFLSTPPSRVATQLSYSKPVELCAFLSTPPSRVATLISPKTPLRRRSFYPRHPRGWRHTGENPTINHYEFLSTPPSRVATAKVYKNVQCLLRKREKIICKIKNNLKHPPHIPIATSKKCTACPKTSDGIGAKLLGKVCLLPPRTGAATQAAHHPEQIRGGGQGAPRGFCSGCQAGKSAGCRFRGQSARPARL